MTVRLAAICLIVAGASAAGTQQPSFKTETRLVVLRATVQNSRGAEVTDLDRDAFTVYENGKRQPITLFRRDDIPVSIAILIDNSGSMRPMRTQVERASLRFVGASNPLDEVCVINFADTPRIDVAMTSDIRSLEAGIARVDSIGGTAMRDAVLMAEDYLREHASRDRRVLLVITDGRDNSSSVTRRQIEEVAQRTDTAVYAIGLFPAVDSSEAKDSRHELDALTRQTGGAAFYPETIDRIDAIAADLAHQIRNQYTIAYAPTNQALDGTYRKIRVEAHAREPVTVHTRTGYMASPPAGRGP